VFLAEMSFSRLVTCCCVFPSLLELHEVLPEDGEHQTLAAVGNDASLQPATEQTWKQFDKTFFFFLLWPWKLRKAILETI
jgi:hypothetical protein